MKVVLMVLASLISALTNSTADALNVGEHVYVDNGNVTIHYAKYGTGSAPYLLFQHGFPDRESTWNDFQIPHFAQSYTVLTPTLRGFTPSSIPPEADNYTADAYASDMAAILDHEGAEEVYLVGHDFGGVIVQLFSYRHPQRVKGMVVIAAPIIPVFLALIEYDKSEQEYARYTIPYYTYQASQPKNISTLVEHILNSTYRAEIAAYLASTRIDGMLHFYDENYPGPPYGRNLSVYNYGPSLVQKVPTMLLWGEQEPYLSPKLTDGSRLIGWFEKGARVVIVPRAGHWVFRDQWKWVNTEMQGFLNLAGSL